MHHSNMVALLYLYIIIAHPVTLTVIITNKITYTAIECNHLILDTFFAATLLFPPAR